MTAAKGFLLKGEGLKFNYRKEKKNKGMPLWHSSIYRKNDFPV